VPKKGPSAYQDLPVMAPIPGCKTDKQSNSYVSPFELTSIKEI